MIAKPQTNIATRFLKLLRPNGPWTIAVIQPKRGSAPICRTFTGNDLSELRRFIADNQGKRNIYFTPNPCGSSIDRKPKEIDVDRMEFAQVDCDPLPGESSDDAKKRHRTRLKSGVVPAPTFVWSSGNGITALWRLDEPCKINGDRATIEECKSLNVALKLALGGKAQGVDDTQNIDRLARLPGTLNLPDEKKRAAGRKVELAGNVEYAPDRIYSKFDFPLPDAPSIVAWEAEEIGPPEPTDDLDRLPVPDRIKQIILKGRVDGEQKEKDDSRSAWRYEAICALIRHHVSDEVILGLFTDARYAISERANEVADPIDYARKEIQRAKRKLAADVRGDFLDPADVPDDDDDGMSKRKRIVPSPWVYVPPERLPRRQFLYAPMYARKFYSLTVAHGGTGKTSVVMTENLSIVTGKPLLGVTPTEEDLRAWFWNGEDPLEEMQRRWAAVVKQFGVTPEDIGDRFFLDSGRELPIKLTTLSDGVSKIAEPIVKELIEAIRDFKIDALTLDPIIATHNAPENDTAAMNAIADAWKRVANDTDCAMHGLHHLRKTRGQDATIEDSRGAIAMVDAARGRRVLNKMAAADAKAAGIKPEEREAYIWADYSKTSMVAPSASREWFQLVSVNLGNGPDPSMPEEGADEVGVAVPWEFTAAPELDPETVNAVADAIRKRNGWRVSDKAKDWIGVPVARALGLDIEGDDDGAKAARKQVRALVKKWESGGLLVTYTSKDEHRKAREFIRWQRAQDDFAEVEGDENEESFG